jgi:TolB protein
MNANGSNQRRLTFTDSDNHEPDWSPDGTQIAFASLHINNYEILIINTDGTHLYNVTNHQSGDYGPAWLPALPGR